MSRKNTTYGIFFLEQRAKGPWAPEMEKSQMIYSEGFHSMGNTMKG
jgi:hypothetical protein